MWARREGMHMVDVVAALIWRGEAFLICQRPAGKARGLLWEFAGGKVEPGETPQQALVRECREELDIIVHVGEEFMQVTHAYPDITVRLTLFCAQIVSGEPRCLEHAALRWIRPEEIPQYDFCPADAPILERLRELDGARAGSLREMQKAAYQNKLDKGFNVTDVHKEFCLLYGEVAEAYDAYRKKQHSVGEELADAAVRSSERERAAIDAERAADKLMMARLMAHHVGEDYDGTINGVSEYGMYITLSNGAEGFVPVRTLEDWFGFDERRMLLRGERTGTVFSLGQPVRVKVQNVELTQCNIDLTLLTPLKGRVASGQRSERKQERDRMRGFNRS